MVSWTEGEDDQLRELYEKYGNNYSRIAEVLGRARTSVRDRIVNTIAVENLRGPWTEEEDAKLVIGLIHHGTTWQEIVKDIPGRSENQARARAMGPHLRSLGYIMDELEAAKKRGALPEEHQRLAGVPWLRFKVAQGVAFCRAPAPGRPKKSSRRPHAVPGLDMGKIRRAYFKISKLSEFTRQRTQYILGYPAEFVRAGRLAEGGGAIELLGVLLGGGGGGGGGGSAGEEVVEMDFEDELEEAAVRRVPRRWELGPGGEPVETVCLVGGCGAPALCSYEGEVKPLYCKAHQKEGMVDLFSEEYLATVLAEPPGGGDGEDGDGDGDDGERGEAAAAGEVPDKTALAKKMNRWGQDARERNKGRGVAQGAWSEEEDALLRKVVEELTREREMKEGKEFQLGDLTQDQWSAAEALMVAGGVRRLRRQCRERWRDRLDPALARGAFSAQEDADLLHAWHHKKMMWAAMAAEPGLLPGRSESIIKQRGSCTTFKTYAARALAYVQSLRDQGELCAKAQALEGEAWEKHLCLRVAEFLRGEDEVEGIDVPLLRAVLGFQKAPADMRGKDSRWGPTYKRPQGPGAATRQLGAHAQRRAAAARDLMAQGKVVGKGGVPLLAPRRCVLAACGELAEYGHEGEVKPIFCSAHKREGMVKVLGTAAAAKHPAKSEPKKKSKKMVTRLVEVTDDEAEDSGEEEEGEGGEGGGGGGEEGPQQYCRREHCTRTALFSQEGAAAPTHCKKHQEPGMVVNLGLRAFATAPLLGPGGGGGRGAAAKGKARKGKKKTKMVEVVEEVTDEEDFSDGGPQRQPAKAEVPQPPPRAAVALFANDRWGSLDRPLACPRSDRPGPHCRPCRLKKGSCEFLNAWRKEMKQKMQNGEISEAAFVAQPKEKKKRRKRKAAAAKKAAPEEPEGPRDLCVVRDCEADAIFSFPGEKPIYCRKHKKKQMVQVAKAPRKKHKQHKKRKETLMDEVDESLFDDGIV